MADTRTIGRIDEQGQARRRRQELIDAVRGSIGRTFDERSADEADRAAAELAPMFDEDDFNVGLVLGSFHWYRMWNRQRPFDGDDLARAVRYLLPVHRLSPKAVPEQLHGLYNEVTGARPAPAQRPPNAATPELRRRRRDRLAEAVRRAADADPPQRPFLRPDRRPTPAEDPAMAVAAELAGIIDARSDVEAAAVLGDFCWRRFARDRYHEDAEAALDFLVHVFRAAPALVPEPVRVALTQLHRL